MNTSPRTIRRLALLASLATPFGASSSLTFVGRRCTAEVSYPGTRVTASGATAARALDALAVALRFPAGLGRWAA
jgi:hypothetical protein